MWADRMTDGEGCCTKTPCYHPVYHHGCCCYYKEYLHHLDYHAYHHNWHCHHLILMFISEVCCIKPLHTTLFLTSLKMLSVSQVLQIIPSPKLVSGKMMGRNKNTTWVARTSKSSLHPSPWKTMKTPHSCFLNCQEYLIRQPCFPHISLLLIWSCSLLMQDQLEHFKCVSHLSFLCKHGRMWWIIFC